MPAKLSFFILLMLTVTACKPGPADPGNLTSPGTAAPVEIATSSSPTQTEKPKPIAVPTGERGAVVFGLTYQGTNGNRILEGIGGYPFQKPIDIPLPGKAIWLLATPVSDGIIWSAALEDGRVFSFHMLENGAVAGEQEVVSILAGQPPAAISDGDNFSLVLVQDADQTPLSHPIYLRLSDSRAYITQNGRVNIINSSDSVTASLDVNALPDARILIDDYDRLLVLTGPTGKYPHNVLGDQIEASGIMLIETLPEPQVAGYFSVDDNEVIEGIAPIWFDLNGDGRKEIIITVSDLELGAGIVVLNETGEIIAQGSKMGTSFRWRHQIAISNFGPREEIEFAVVRTPHIAGTVEFYQLEDGVLSITAEFPGVTSHTIGSRNLDLAAAGDFDGDGRSELLVPSPDLTEYIAVRRTASGAEQAWRLPLDGIISSNLAGAPLPDGRIMLAVGRSDHSIRLWLPQE